MTQLTTPEFKAHGDPLDLEPKSYLDENDCHIFLLFSVVCDVWYLPPMTRMENEDAVKFANRVKAEIARQGGLVDLVWYVQFC